MRVTARVIRSGDWWAVEVPEVDGLFTQARRLDQVPATVRDALGLLDDVDPATVEVEIAPILSEAKQRLLVEFKEANQVLAGARERASTTSRSVVGLLREEGLTVRDIGTLLGLSPQRVSQLQSARKD